MSWQRRAAQVAAMTTIAAGLVGSTAQQARAAYAYTYWIPPAGDLVVHGRGFGHGRGMSQYGAQGAAIAGRTATQILDFYYPGTATTTVSGAMRIWLTADTTASIKVKPATGLKVRDLGDNAVFTLPVSSSITQWAIDPYSTNRTRVSYYYAPQRRWIYWAAGGRSVLRGMAQFEGPPVTFLILPDGSSKPYRGALRAADRSGSELDTLNVLGLDLYVRGVVPKEAITSWRPAALQAQAIAARTYSVSRRDAAVAAGKDYDLCDTVSCQVYGGYAGEVASTNSAVAATAGRIRTYAGRPILAEFSSSNGGYTAPGPVAYQVGKADPYDGYPGNGNPNHSWTVTLNRATVQANLGVGTLRRIRVDDRNGLGTWGGRVISATAVGSAGSRTLTGEQMRFALGVRSAWFSPEQSAIIKRWLAIGAAASGVGNVAGDEYVVRGGTGQNFSKGRIYRSHAGAWEVYGAFWTRYAQIGGPNHRIGLPASPRIAGGRPNSLIQAYGGGRIFYAPQITYAREVSGPIYYAYYAVTFERGRLGLPTSFEYAVTGGRRQLFEGGYITWTSATNRTTTSYR